MTTARRLAVLTGLYAAQGLPYGFFTQALPAVLRERGVSLEIIGATALLALPWVLKAVWAPLVERTLSLRTWALGLQGVSIVGALGLAVINPTASLVVLSVAVLAANMVSATQDIATDGLAVATLTPEERGWGNGLQVGGYRVGMIVGGGALLIVYDKVGWTPTVLIMAALLVMCSLPLLLSEVGRTSLPIEGRPFGWDWFRLAGAWPWLAVLVAFKLGDYLVQGMLRPWLVDLGTSLSELGVLFGGVGFTAGLLGALAGGALIEPLGRKRALVGFGVLQTAALAGYALSAALGGTGIWIAVAAEHFLGGCATAALFTCMMDASRPERGATDYTLQASVVVAASMAAAGLSGVVAGQVGYTALFAIGAALSLLAPVLAAIVCPPAHNA